MNFPDEMSREDFQLFLKECRISGCYFHQKRGALDLGVYTGPLFRPMKSAAIAARGSLNVLIHIPEEMCGVEYEVSGEVWKLVAVGSLR